MIGAWWRGEWPEIQMAWRGCPREIQLALALAGLWLAWRVLWRLVKRNDEV